MASLVNIATEYQASQPELHGKGERQGGREEEWEPGSQGGREGAREGKKL